MMKVYGTTKFIKSLNVDATKNQIGIIGFIPVFDSLDDAEIFADNKGELFSMELE